MEPLESEDMRWRPVACQQKRRAKCEKGVIFKEQVTGRPCPFCGRKGKDRVEHYFRAEGRDPDDDGCAVLARRAKGEDLLYEGEKMGARRVLGLYDLAS